VKLLGGVTFGSDFTAMAGIDQVRAIVDAEQKLRNGS
jgi:hypothetical protein